MAVDNVPIMSPASAITPLAPETIRDRLVDDLAPFGLGLAAHFNIRHYNPLVPATCRIREFEREDALAIIVANTRDIWHPFLAALRARPELLEHPHPFDTFVMETVAGAAARIPVPMVLRWSHDPPPRRIAIQRAAHAAGLARLARTHLSIHPVHGPWIGLRAVLVCDLPGPAEPAPEPPDPCSGCETRCQALLDEAIAASRADGDLETTPRSSWRRWVAVRDACPVGREYRYYEDQIRYHYTKDKAVLRAAVLETAQVVPG